MGLSNKYSCQGHCIWRRSFHKAAMSKCPIPLYVVVSTKLNHPEITFGTAPFAESSLKFDKIQSYFYLLLCGID